MGLLDEKVKACGGAVVKTLGDGMVCQFGEADGAFRAACGMQEAALAADPGAHTKLTIKVGFTWGPVLTKGGDVFGDTVNVCARLVALAGPNQVLTTQQTVAALSPGLRERCRQLYPMKIRGRATEVKVCDVLWRSDPDVTETIAHPGPAKTRQWILKLSYGGETITVEPAGAIKLGRDKANDVVVESSLASRVHARIYGRGGNFVIADQSSNGTYLLNDGTSRELMLRREEAVMGERGWIGLGGPAGSHGSHVLRFRLEQRSG